MTRTTTTKTLTIALLAAALPALAGSNAALAMPGDDPETMSCKQLWVARNAIYKQNGYCFHTTKARKFFGNKGCTFVDQDDVPLSKGERKDVAEYRHWEIVNGC